LPQEAEIMMELKHPFIARALTCAVKHHTTTGHDADTTAEGIVSTYKNISYSRVVSHISYSSVVSQSATAGW
jgi:hypothetical protein